MIEKIKTLIREQSHCVLATVSDNKPHCSLMSYVPDDDCQQIYMASQRNTQKYRNLLKNPFVSLLIDTRTTDQNSAPAETHALTVTGIFSDIQDSQKKETIREKLALRHPQNKAFLQDADIGIFGIKVERFLLLEGLTKAHMERP